MKGRTTWVQVFTGADGKDRLVMTYDRGGAGAPNWNNLCVTGYDYNGIFVAGVLVDRFWREVNGDLVISPPRCRNNSLVNISSSYTMKTSSWTRLVQESHPEDGTYDPSEYEGHSTGSSISVLNSSRVYVHGELYKNFGNVNHFSINVGLEGQGYTKTVNVHGIERVYDDAQVAFKVNVDVDENGFLVNHEVLGSWTDVDITLAHGSFESSDHWAQFENTSTFESTGKDLVEVREITDDDT